MLVSCLVYSPTLKMEVACSSETSADFQRSTQRCIPEDTTLHNHRYENLKSYILWHICRKPRHVARQWHNIRVSTTAVTSLNNDEAAGNSVLHAVRRRADSDATIKHVTQRRTHQQSN
jgi:hypothetical protein